MNDQRIAEWLVEDAAPREEARRPEAPHDGAARRPVAVSPVSHRRRLPAVIGLEGKEERIALLVLVIGRRIRRRPLTALAVGVAAGFVIGGALSFRAGRILLAAGARHVARELLKQLL
jgi:hypothetical protein